MSTKIKNSTSLNTEATTLQPQDGFVAMFSQYWLEVSLLLGVSLAMAIIFKKGFDRGQSLAWRRFTSELEELKNSQSNIANQLKDSNSKLQAEFRNSQILQKGSVSISYLTEGESRHPLPDGYVMRIERKLEHRSVAERILRRDLMPNEIVHHIYGPAKHDNSPSNLCVLDRDQHDLFHTYLEREVRIKGRFPRVSDQKSSLKRNFGGILLDESQNLFDDEN